MEVGETGILEVVEVPLCQGIPMLGDPNNQLLAGLSHLFYHLLPI